MYFQPTQLSTSRRPDLRTGESLIVQQASVGLYNGKNKVESAQDGVCYLTSHRIIYVDNKDPDQSSFEIPLNSIAQVESYGGFLMSSPKVILHLDPKVLSDHARPPAPVISTSVAGVWSCPICFFTNQATVDKCQLCGVRHVETNKSTTPEPLPATEGPGGSNCRVCTFINHPSLNQCEMCGADLITEPLFTENPIESLTIEDDPHVRIAFRHGGQPRFLQNLKTAIQTKAWDAPVIEETVPVIKAKGVGISAIRERVEQSTQKANDTMSDAFQDLNRLMAKATEMVKLAESISLKMSKDMTTDNDKDMATLKGYLLNLGISSPVTRDSAGSIYHQELARELADFLSKFLESSDSIKSLTDVYCIFNRARGVALVSPEDLYKASTQFESLKLPFRLKRFPSGLLVVQSLAMDDDKAASRILSLVKKHGHLTALQLAEIEHWALAVAAEQLFMTEQKGLLCRDQGPVGLTFYENLFCTA
ncbi:EAP30/Vps36 family-domain-containing protein [Phycomyces nitens]|nr:EAP30/Vps36 family-domain-containing protein [Phycomyces nitens]